jgi:sulfur carrier protein
MEVRVNGEIREVPEGATVLLLLNALQLEPGRVAVELDREIVKQTDWAATVLRSGAQLEIVQFVGGG